MFRILPHQAPRFSEKGALYAILPHSRRKNSRFPALVEVCEPRTLLTNPGYLVSDVPPIDGRGTTPRHPDWGSPGEMLLRMAPAAYADGSSMPAGAGRESAREISDVMDTADASQPNAAI